MMGLRIPKAHKAITEARVREHPSDVDLRYTIIGLGFFVIIALVIILDFFDKYNNGQNHEILEVLTFCCLSFMLPLYIMAKLCKQFPLGARWAIFYFCSTVSLSFLVLVLFFG